MTKKTIMTMLKRYNLIQFIQCEVSYLIDS